MLQPIGNKIAIRPDKDLEKTEGGIVLPDNAGELKKRYRGTVVAVGPGKRLEKLDAAGKVIGILDRREEMPVKVGDVIHWEDRGGFCTETIEFNGEKLVMLVPSDLMAREVEA